MNRIKMSVIFVMFFSSNSLMEAHVFWSKQQLVKRKKDAERVRDTTARSNAKKTKIINLKTNGDLQCYKDKRGSYSKALLHHINGMVSPASFNSMVKALKSGKSKDFDAIILGGCRRLDNPQAAYTYSLEGADISVYPVPEAPRLASSQAAGEMVELYWQALLRDIPFNVYSTDLLAAVAIGDLNALNHFKGPKISGLVTPQTLFRGMAPGELVGPYISQFLYQPIPEHGKLFEQLYFGYVIGADNNFLTNVNDLLLVQNGEMVTSQNVFQSAGTYIFTGRDLGTYVHKDYPTQAWVNAALILSGYGDIALDPNNPYKTNRTQKGFVTYGESKIIELINIAAATALKACWFQKWMIALRLRPEYFGFLIQEHIVSGCRFDLHNQIINSPVLPTMFSLYGTYLLPQMYAEGSPNSPSYPSAHAVVAGACATILKAFFDENFIVPDPVQPDVTNTSLEPYGGTLLVGNELNKLAGNISMGRNFAGVNYRSDCAEGLKFGEKIALSVLNDEAYTNNESFKGYIVTKFNGNTIVIGKKITV